MTETAEEARKLVERYRKLLVDKTAEKAPRGRLRRFKKKLKRYQRRARRLVAPAQGGGEAQS